MKKKAAFAKRFLPFAGAVGIFLVCSAFAYSLLRSQLYANQLLARGEAEQTINTLFAALRQESGGGFRFIREPYDVAAVLTEYPQLREKIAGIASYSASGRLLFSYGEVFPKGFSPAAPSAHSREDDSWRNYIFDKESRTLNIITLLPAPRQRRMHREDGSAAFFIFSVWQRNYWIKARTAWAVFAGAELLFIIAIWHIRNLLTKNRTYREKLREQKELVALGTAARTLAHEIKNPLSAIQLQADIIAKVCPEKVGTELQVITQEVGRLKRLTDRVGDFLREPRGMPVPVELGDFTRGVLTHSGEEAGFVAEESLWVLLDHDRLHSIIYNLLRNALESGSPPGSIMIRVFRPDGDGDFAALEVLDRGEGIPPEKIKRIFDPFFTTKSKGSGVGLAIARRFAEAADGRLIVENREGGGVSALLKIPCKQETAKK